MATIFVDAMLQLDPPQVAQNLLELLALLLPVAVALLGIILRSTREDSDEHSLLRSLSLFAVSGGIVFLVAGAWVMRGWFNSAELPPEIGGTLTLVVWALTAISTPMAAYGIVVGYHEIQGWMYKVRNNDTPSEREENNGE